MHGECPPCRRAVVSTILGKKALCARGLLVGPARQRGAMMQGRWLAWRCTQEAAFKPSEARRMISPHNVFSEDGTEFIRGLCAPALRVPCCLAENSASSRRAPRELASWWRHSQRRPMLDVAGRYKPATSLERAAKMGWRDIDHRSGASPFVLHRRVPG